MRFHQENFFIPIRYTRDKQITSCYNSIVNTVQFHRHTTTTLIKDIKPVLPDKMSKRFLCSWTHLLFFRGSSPRDFKRRVGETSRLFTEAQMAKSLGHLERKATHKIPKELIWTQMSREFQLNRWNRCNLYPQKLVVDSVNMMEFQGHEHVPWHDVTKKNWWFLINSNRKIMKNPHHHQVRREVAKKHDSRCWCSDFGKKSGRKSWNKNRDIGSC